MIFEQTPISGSYLVKQEPRSDQRGFFARSFCEEEFSRNGLNSKWAQVNNSMSTKAGTLRGLHIQSGKSAEVKLVRCISGAIWDVIVDLRRDSLTYSRYFGTTLSAGNRHMLYVPIGCAHGFISLYDNSELLYMVSAKYDPLQEHTLLWSDITVAIKWPIAPQVISDKDKLGVDLNHFTQYNF